MGPGQSTDDSPGRDLALQYDEEYFNNYYSRGTAPPYRKGEPHWEQFFGAVADNISRSLGPKTAFDSGCAIGFLVEALWDRGVETQGRDISSFAIGEVRPDVRPYCSVGSVTQPIEGMFDLVLSIEVLEHVSEEDGVAAIKHMTSATDQILFSSTPSDFEEPTHINVRPPIYWIRHFAAHGFAPVLSYDGTYLCPHALLFRKSNGPVDDELLNAAAELVRLRTSLSDQTRRAIDLNIELAQSLRAVRDLDDRQSATEAVRLELASELRTIERELTDERRRSDATEADLHSLRARHQQDLHEALLLDARLASIESNAFWRATSLARKMTYWMPTPVRTSLKSILRSAKAVARPGSRPVLEVAGVIDVPALAVDPTLVSPGPGLVLAEHQFPQLQPLRVFRTPDRHPTVNVVTDSISSGSLFGGVATALILATQLAVRIDGKLRIVTRTAPGDPAVAARLLREAGIDEPMDLEVVYAGTDSATAVPMGDQDIFIPTSWWTAVPTVTAVGYSRVVYLLQEDERMFYPMGDESLRCAELLSDPRLHTVINTDMLFRHFTDGPSPLPGLADRSIVFEPAFPSGLFYQESPRLAPGSKRTFLFYARPNNARNLYWRGLEAIERSILAGTLDVGEWRFVFVGKDIGTVVLPGSPDIETAENLSLEEYARIIRTADLGLSLIYSPHPSYPPLDLAASGAVVVTNSFGTTKVDLTGYSSNIICAEPTVDALVDGIASAVRAVSEHRTATVGGPLLIRSWSETLKPVVDQILRWRTEAS